MAGQPVCCLASWRTKPIDNRLASVAATIRARIAHWLESSIWARKRNFSGVRAIIVRLRHMKATAQQSQAITKRIGVGIAAGNSVKTTQATSTEAKRRGRAPTIRLIRRAESRGGQTGAGGTRGRAAAP